MNPSPVFLGIDVGSLTCDAVLVDADGRVLSAAVVPTGARNRVAIARARAEVLRAAGLPEDAAPPTVATGYGRRRVEGRLGAVTEITCHARGIAAVMPDAELLVDIGGQDSKAIRLGPGGRVADFAMNDKCAAGTGRFLEAMARALEVDLDDLGPLALRSEADLSISSVCTVFAESEVVSLLAEGGDPADVARGICRSVAARTRGLVRRVADDPASLRVALSGGVARNAGVVAALEEALGTAIRVPPAPDTIGALGAALFARERAG